MSHHFMMGGFSSLRPSAGLLHRLHTSPESRLLEVWVALGVEPEQHRKQGRFDRWLVVCNVEREFSQLKYIDRLQLPRNMIENSMFEEEPDVKSSVHTEEGLIQDEFSESVKMSTYLVAFIVGEMRNLSQDVNGTL
ncbi:hypothetical protein A6R68_05438, partial [Neotoma lepida]